MTTHEMILLCSSLQGVRRCIPLCLVLGCHFCRFWKIWVPPTYSLKHAAAQQNLSWASVLPGHSPGQNLRAHQGTRVRLACAWGKVSWST